MPTTKPRITVTLERHAHEVLARLSAASGDSMSEIVAGFVDLAVPSLERVVVILERAKAAPEEVRSGLSAAIDRADRVLMPAIQSALDQADLFISDATLATVREPDAQAAPPPARPAPGGAKAGALEGSTPVPVTRGSGRGKTRGRGRPVGRVTGQVAGRKGVRRG